MLTNTVRLRTAQPTEQAYCLAIGAPMSTFQPVSDVDIYRSAARWLERHGDRAVAIARERVAEMQASGDTVGTDAWLRIIEAIEALRDGPSGTVS
jgi:hypothetical protein